MPNFRNSAGVELLAEDNYETWKMQVKALLTKGDLWQYVSGGKLKPEVHEGTDQGTRAVMEDAIQTWIREDEKASADIFLSIGRAELEHVKDCKTSQEVWNRLEAIFASKKPTRKSTLVKQLLQRMKKEEDIREHVKKFYGAVNELAAMDIKINSDVLAIMLLNSLPKSFENFRCAIVSRDNLPDMKSLIVQILQENNARKHKLGDDSGTMVASCSKTPKKFMSSPNVQALTEVENKNKVLEPSIKMETRAVELNNGDKFSDSDDTSNDDDDDERLWRLYNRIEKLPNTTETNSCKRSIPKQLSDGKQKCSCRVTCKNRKCSCRKNEVACHNCGCDPANCNNTDRDVFILKLKRRLNKQERRMK